MSVPCCGDIVSLSELVDALNYEFESGEDDLPGRVRNIMERYEGDPEEWTKFCYYDEFRYTRNLVEKNKHYVLLLLCWGPKQQSPIHDHAGSNCWLRVMRGNLEETMYDYKEDVHPEARATHLYHEGQISYINGSSLCLPSPRPLVHTLYQLFVCLCCG